MRNLDIVGQALSVEDEDGQGAARRVASEEGILTGVSSSGVVAWAVAVGSSVKSERESIPAILEAMRGGRDISEALFL